MNEIFLIYRNPTIAIAHVIGAIVALFAPIDVLDNYQFLSNFVNIIHDSIPSIRGFMRNSDFPQVTGFYFSLSLITGFPVFIELCKHPEYFIPDGKKAIERFGYFHIFYPIFGVLIFFGFFIFSFLHSGKKWDSLPIHDSRFALALVGPLFAWMPYIMLAFSIATVKIYKRYA